MIVISKKHPLSHAKKHQLDESIPSPARIGELTAEIRKSWTPAQRRLRASLAAYFAEQIATAVQSKQD